MINKGSPKKNIKFLKNLKKKEIIKIIKRLEHLIYIHCKEQILAGADIIQLFDSWAGLIEKKNLKEFCINPNKNIVNKIKKNFPNNPIICFPKGINKNINNFIKEVKPHGISIDYDINLKKLNLNNEDIIIIADLDEIPDTKTVLNLKNNGVDCMYNLEMDLYYYNITCKYDKKWLQPKILNYGSYIKYNSPHVIFRELPNIPIIKNGGWHFSYFGDVEFIKNKLRNFTHEELNNDFNTLLSKRVISKVTSMPSMKKVMANSGFTVRIKKSTTMDLKMFFMPIKSIIQKYFDLAA